MTVEVPGFPTVDIDRDHGPSHSRSMPSVLQAPVVPDMEHVRAEPRVDDARLLFEEARRRRHRRQILVVGVMLCSLLCLGITLLVTGGGGHFFGGPPTASSNGPVGGATIQQSAPEGHGRQTPVTARPSACDKGVVFPRDAKASASLLPCYKVVAFPPGMATTVHPGPRVGRGAHR
jgi:hypothetical protein